MPKTLQQSATLPAAPAALYTMYLDAAAHAAFTGGGPARITPEPGGEFRAFDGRIHGRILALTPDRQIVQSWRSFEFEPHDLDATLVLTFWPTPSGSRVELVQVNAPDHLADKLEAGWPMRYWEPWRGYLTRER
jgi:activator of HSP90 ATPase